jgi:glutamate---cysteine ligase / carboxylate-amine ligase
MPRPLICRIFRALTASGPFWGGHGTGLASSRAVIFGGLPPAGPPHMLADWTEFEEYMNTLLRAGTIRSIKEVWWDVWPHPDFGTVEIRMFDGVPALHEAGMAGALSPSLLHRFGTQLDRGGRLPSGGLTDAVDALVTEFAEDRFVRPGEGRYAGP